MFNIIVAEVHGVITFYKDFRTKKPAGPIVQVCRAEACQARGGREVWDKAQLEAQGKAVVVEEVLCLGNWRWGRQSPSLAPLIKAVAPNTWINLFTSHDLALEVSREPAIDAYLRKSGLAKLLPTALRILGLEPVAK